MQNFFSTYRPESDMPQTSPVKLKTSIKTKRKTCIIDKENSAMPKVNTKAKRQCLGSLPTNIPNHDYSTSLLSFTKALDLCIDLNSQDSHDSGFASSQPNSQEDLNESIESLDELNTYCLQASAHTNRLINMSNNDSFGGLNTTRRCLFKSAKSNAHNERILLTPTRSSRSLFSADDSYTTTPSLESKNPLTPVSVNRHVAMELAIETASPKFSTLVEQSIDCIEQMLEGTASSTTITLTNTINLKDHHDHIKQSLDFECQSNTHVQFGELENTNRLIGDRSKYHILPTKSSIKHTDLNVISTQTLGRLLNKEFQSEIEHLMIVDSRYPYEYEGGHIQNAQNLYTKEQINENFMENEELKGATERANLSGKRVVIVFHCEFSSERGPSMLRFLRNQDRAMNKDSYPRLNYPELYLLEGGYKAFYEMNQVLCEPRMYKPMLHADHVHELKHFRAKTKTWNRQGSSSCMSAFKNPLLSRSKLQRFPRSTLF